MIPFFFTRYRKAPLATCVSFCSSACYVVTLFFTVGYAFNWDGVQDTGSLGESLLVAVCFAAIGFGLSRLANWLAVRKQRKLAAREAAQTPVPPVAPAANPKPGPASRLCPKCGTKVEPGDVFCVNCGAKL